MQVNDLIFKELIKRGYTLDGNTRVWNIADSKLWYLTPEQAQGFLDLDHDSAYKKETGQPAAKELLRENIKRLAENISTDSINIIDLGCGDGEKAAEIIIELKRIMPKLHIRYCPIDISGYMVQSAIKTFSELNVGEVVEFKYNISDFENLENVTPLLRTGKFKKNLILLLGNTLGNFEVNELLYVIRTSMEKGDLFFLDTAVDDHKQKERALSYQNNKKSNAWLINVPLQLGLSKEDVEFGVRFRNSRIECYYTITRDKKISFQNKNLYFMKGDQMIVLVAYKHDKTNLKEYLNMHFDNVSVTISKDNGKALALCMK